MEEHKGHRGQHMADSHQEEQQKQQKNRQQQQQYSQQPRSLQSPPLPSSPQGYQYQNQQQSYFQHHQSSRPQYSGHQQPYQHQDYQNHNHGPYDMASMVQGLPRIDYRQPQYASGSQGYGPPGAAAAPMHGQPTTSHQQYPGPPVGPVQMQVLFMAQQAGAAPHQYYGNSMPGMAPANMTGRPNYAFYPNQQQGPASYYYLQSPQYPGSPDHQGYGHSPAPANYTTSAYPQGRRSQSTTRPGGAQSGGTSAQQIANHRSRQEQKPAKTITIVRGPPRKPKQSGHAIWIGNLPLQTNLMDLVHHVCQHADGLQSLFLIAKSNCAFANFPNEESCQTAQQKVNDTWFKSVRLVSRLRKSSVDNAQGITPSPSRPSVTVAATENTDKESTDKTSSDDAQLETKALSDPPKKTASPSSLVVDGTGKTASIQPQDNGMTSTPSSNSKSGKISTANGKVDRYFILKSLTVEDLALSVRTGIWATQSHNEQVLNAAFKSCDSVYLVFSVNKSGEYYGYARMTSEIDNDPAAAVEFAPTSHSFNEIDLPKAILTDTTEKTPRGRIIDDSARGTIFWEVQSDDGFSTTLLEADEEETADEQAEVEGTKEAEEEVEKEVEKENDSKEAEETTDTINHTDAEDSASTLEDGAGEPKAWGKPFKLEWLSTVRLPFYRTRGLRNPLNANREVKIARDGTEVDAEVGKKLVGLFHQPEVGSPVPGDGRSGSFSYAGGY